MIVVDASAILELLLRTRKAHKIEDRMFGDGESWHAPHLIDVEVLQVLRRLARDQTLTQKRAQEALDDLADLPMERYPHRSLLQRSWELRHNLTAYDAVYVALAEALHCPLITCDARLASTPGLESLVELI